MLNRCSRVCVWTSESCVFFCSWTWRPVTFWKIFRSNSTTWWMISAGSLPSGELDTHSITAMHSGPEPQCLMRLGGLCLAAFSRTSRRAWERWEIFWVRWKEQTYQPMETAAWHRTQITSCSPSWTSWTASEIYTWHLNASGSLLDVMFMRPVCVSSLSV